MRFEHGWTTKGVILAVCMGCLLGIVPVVLLTRLLPQPLLVRPVLVRDARLLPKVVFVRKQPVVKGLPTKDISVPVAPTLLFVGDIMLDRQVADRTKVSGQANYPYVRLPAGWFDSFDYAVANLEGPVTDQRRPPVKTIDFQFDPAVLPALKATGIDAVSQANNHALDQGRVGAEDSRKRLLEAGFTVFGDQVSDGAIALATSTVKDVKFAFVGFNTTDNELDEAAASSTLAMARAEADRVIVFMHWGLEYKDRPTEEMRRRARWFIDQGVDAVIGSHPHWAQGVESYRGRPIVYSLGNFIFDQEFSVQTRQGLAVSLRFEDATTTLNLMPTQTDMSQPRVVEGEEKTKRLEALARVSGSDVQEGVKAGVVVLTKE